MKKGKRGWGAAAAVLALGISTGASAAKPFYVGSFEYVGTITSAGTFLPTIPDAATGVSHRAVMTFLPADANGTSRYFFAGVSGDATCKSDVATLPVYLETEDDGNGWEKGTYTVDPVSGALKTTVSLTRGLAQDTNGSCGLNDPRAASSAPARAFLSPHKDYRSVRGLKYNDMVLTDATTGERAVLRHVKSKRKTMVGAWEAPPASDSTIPDPEAFLFFFDDGQYYVVEAQHDRSGSPACTNGGLQAGDYVLGKPPTLLGKIYSLSFENIKANTLGFDCGVGPAASRPLTLSLSFPDSQHAQLTRPDGSTSLLTKLTSP